MDCRTALAALQAGSHPPADKDGAGDDQRQQPQNSEIMPTLTVAAVETPAGYDFIRSDGKCFHLVAAHGGGAVLYAGHRGNPPILGLVSFDVSVADKFEAAREWILSYPEMPIRP
ncbi:MAG TPA: hypothetical protein VIY90_01140 [Steroidobacteraceae bacterium]